MSGTDKSFPMSEIVTATGPMIARRGFDCVIEIYDHLFGEHIQKIEFFMTTIERAEHIADLGETAERMLRTAVPDLPLILDYHVRAATNGWDALSGETSFEERRDLIWSFADALDERFGKVVLPKF